MLNLDAPWWNPNNPQDGRPLVRHAPDHDHYHYPDGRMLEKIRAGIGEPVLVPRAKRDGGSPGFDARVPGVVHVDPDAPDGGTIVDLQSVDSAAMEAALAISGFPHEVFYHLGVSPQELEAGVPPRRSRETERAAPVGSGYVVAKAGRDGAPEGFSAGVARVVSGHRAAVNKPLLYQVQEEQAVTPTPPLSSLPPLQQPAPVMPQQPQPAMPQQHYHPPITMQPQPQWPPPYYPPPGPDPATAAMMNNLADSLRSLQAQIGSLQQPAPPSPRKARAVNMTTRPVQEDGQGRRLVRPSGSRPTFDEEDLRPIPGRPPRHTDDDGYDEDEDGQLKSAFEHDEDEEEPRIGRRVSLVAERNHVIKRKRQTLKDVKKAEDKDDGVLYGFETLDIPYVTGPIPQKAKLQVFFEYPRIGKTSARFHGIIEGKNSVTLVYDTRYEDGQQYLPPDLADEAIKLTVPHLKKEFAVTSMDIVYSHGVFDHIVLIKVPEEPAGSEFFEEQSS